MEKKPFDINRNIYKSIKNMNREQLSSFLSDVYETGRRDYDLDELREVISAVSGIGEHALPRLSTLSGNIIGFPMSKIWSNNSAVFCLYGEPRLVYLLTEHLSLKNCFHCCILLLFSS